MPVTRPATATGPAAEISDATLRRFVGYRLKRSFDVVRSDLARALEPLGLRMLTFSVLVLIVDNPGLRPSRLADALAIERPNMVAILDELEERGLIERRRDPSDRRAHALTATAAGRRLSARAVAAGDAHEAALVAAVSAADRRAFLRVLGQIDQAGRGRAT